MELGIFDVYKTIGESLAVTIPLGISLEQLRASTASQAYVMPSLVEEVKLTSHRGNFPNCRVDRLIRYDRNLGDQRERHNVSV